MRLKVYIYIAIAILLFVPTKGELLGQENTVFIQVPNVDDPNSFKFVSDYIDSNFFELDSIIIVIEAIGVVKKQDSLYFSYYLCDSVKDKITQLNAENIYFSNTTGASFLNKLISPNRINKVNSYCEELTGQSLDMCYSSSTCLKEYPSLIDTILNNTELKGFDYELMKLSLMTNKTNDYYYNEVIKLMNRYSHKKKKIFFITESWTGQSITEAEKVILIPKAILHHQNKTRKNKISVSFSKDDIINIQYCLLPKKFYYTHQFYMYKELMEDFDIYTTRISNPCSYNTSFQKVPKRLEKFINKK
jgi:hypothetical protein